MNHRKSSILCLLVTCWLGAIDNHHFYRASNFFPVYDEPRFQESWLSSFDFTLGGGTSHHSKNSCVMPFDNCVKKSCLLNICGYYNMRALGQGLPNKDLSNPVDLALTNLALVPERGTFGMFSFGGTFSIFEANFFYTQNLDCGFFLQAHIPFRSMKISDIDYQDLSPDDAAYPNINTAEWQTFLNIFPAMLERYDLDINCTKSAGAGDLSLLAGWTWNYQETEVLDFIDLTIRAGVLIPTGKKARINKAFSLPTGYNGHVGFPISCDLSLGLYEWATFGAHFGVLPFDKKSQCVRVKTDPEQTGLISLVTVPAEVRAGTLWDAVAYFKADHFCAGLSFIFGYTFAKQQRATILPSTLCDTNNELIDCLPTDCINQCDLINSGWNMQTFNFLAEYDFTSGRDCSYTPRLGIFYNAVITGRHVFTTGMAGATAGIDVSWIF